jgi:DNA topoisomerase-2
MPPKKHKPEIQTSLLSYQTQGDSGVSDPLTPKTPSKKTSKKSKLNDVDLDKLLEEDSKKYNKKELKQHILDLPDTYIGSVVPGEIETWVVSEHPTEQVVEKDVTQTTEKDTFNLDDDEEKKSITSHPSSHPPLQTITLKKITVTMGLYKIVDEVLQNAADNVPRTRIAHEKDENVEQTTQIKVTFEDNGWITIQNNGDSIPIVEHAQHKVLIPTMIFGELLTSGNYDQTEDRRWGGKNGYGSKCPAKGTLIPSWDGEMKRIENYSVGDRVIGDDGRPRTILSTTQGTGRLFKISQERGQPYVVNEHHTLTLKMQDHKRIFWNSAKGGWTVLWWDRASNNIKAMSTSGYRPTITCPECKEELHSDMKRHYRRQHKDIAFPRQQRKGPTTTPTLTPDIEKARKELEDFVASIPDDNTLDISLTDYMQLPPSTQNRLSGFKTQCVQWPSRHVELDPYVLGLWLGDGNSNGNGFAIFAKKDPEILCYLQRWGETHDATFSQVATKREHPVAYSIRIKAPLKKILNRYGLVNNKRIPKEYLINSSEVRLKVLAGLIDTDGTADRDGTRISITQWMNHTELINDIEFLVQSLGMACHRSIKNTTWTYKGELRRGKAHNLNITGQGINDIPTLLPRKKCNSPVKRQTENCGPISVEEISPGEFVGLEVDGNNRFALQDFTVTHNCSNIYSKEFIVETVDRVRQKKFVQKWSNNMANVTPAKVTSFTGKPYTKIKFLPDYVRFGCQGLTQDMKSLLTRRVYDLAGVTGVSVFLNGKKLPIRHFQHYTELYLDKSTKRTYECVYDKKDKNTMAWEIVACPSPDGTFRHVSYVNFVSTFQGGHHVDWVSAKIAKKVTDMVNEKMTKSQSPIQPKHVKNNLWIFINASIINPSFSSQTKEFLTTSVSSLPACDLSDAFYTKLIKSEIVERAKQLKDFHEQKLVTKTDGRKVKTVSGIPKLEDANEAGGKKSRKCTLIICEGDSARSFAIAGLGVVGRDYYGVYPLKGKLMNIRDASQKEISENKEINELKKILGLREGVKSIDDLRYGELMILTDEDVDGIHIKALVMNLFDVSWREIMKSGFMVSMYTPLVKIRKGKTVVASFFNEHDFDEWKQKNSLSGLDVRYYKGLGTHDANEARECFKTMQKIKYTYDDKAGQMLQMGFDKKFSDQRKTWIAQHHHIPLDYKAKQLSISEFIDKGLIMFSNADNIRSIPSFMDGFKPSQRKAICGVLRRNQTKAIKISQLVGPISSEMAYHHGEKSLESTIVNMAQNFVGSNNINLLRPEGQFGTRLKGGDDAASSRYIFTYMEPIARKIFVREDDALLRYRMEDGKKVEPDFFLPVIPMILVNGCSGIGTGFSTSIPNHSPFDIIQGIRDILAQHPSKPLVPWYRKFRGDIVEQSGQFVSKGKWSRTDRTVHITELPLGVWTDTYKSFLDKITIGRAEVPDTPTTKKRKRSTRPPCVTRYKLGNKHDEQSIDLYVDLDKDYTNDEITTMLNLSETKTCSESNMHVFDPYGHLVKFNTSNDMLHAFCAYRIKFYDIRKQYQLQCLRKDMVILEEKIRFIQEIINKTLPILDRSKKDVCMLLQKHKYKANPHATPIKIPSVSSQDWVNASDPYVVKNELYSRTYTSVESKSEISETTDVEKPEEEMDPKGDQLLRDYRYLVSTSVFNMTREEIQSLQAEYDEKKSTYSKLEQSTPAQLWMRDLDELEKELVIHNKSNL